MLFRSRGGVWQVNIDTAGTVSLTFVRPVNLQQVVTVSRDFAQFVYDPQIQGTNIAPAYTLLTTAPLSSKNITTFDQSGTRFASNRDNYSDPGSLDKYLKFPKTGVI